MIFGIFIKSRRFCVLAHFLKAQNQPFLINGSNSIHQKRFSKNRKFNFPAKVLLKNENFWFPIKYTRYEKNVGDPTRSFRSNNKKRY